MATADVTAEFAQTLRTSIKSMTVRAKAITEVVGASEFGERMKRRQDTLAAVGRALLKREIILRLADSTRRKSTFASFARRRALMPSLMVASPSAIAMPSAESPCGPIAARVLPPVELTCFTGG
jgi:hypothetical protein